VGNPHRTHHWFNFRTGMVKSKLKNIVLSLMAIQAEMRGKQREDLGQVIALLKRIIDEDKQ